MALIIVISTGDFQERWNVLSFSFSESRKWRLGLSDFIITISSVMIVFSTLERYPFATPNQNNFFVQQHDFLCRVLIE